MVRPRGNNVAHAIWDVYSRCWIHHLDRLPRRRIVILCGILICLVSQFYYEIDLCLMKYNVAAFTLAFVSGALSMVSLALMPITSDSAANTV